MMFKNPEIKNLLYFAYNKNKLLFEIKPSVFGNEISNLELFLWQLFDEELEKIKENMSK